MPFHALPEQVTNSGPSTPSVVYWCAQPPRLQVRQEKPVKYPFMLECAKHCTDDNTRQIFEKAAFGSLPTGFTIKNKPNYRISARVRKNIFTEPIPSNIEQATKIILRFISQHGNLVSGGVETDTVKTKKGKARKPPYRLSLSHRKPFRQSELKQFIDNLSERNELSANQTRELNILVHAGFIFTHIQPKHLRINAEHSSICGIDGLRQDSQGHYTITRTQKARTVVATRKGTKTTTAKAPIKPRNLNSDILGRLKTIYTSRIASLNLAPDNPQSLQDLLLRCDL